LGTTFVQNDYNVWRTHFGETAGSGSALGPPSQTTVPGPSAVLLAAMGLLAASLCRRSYFAVSG
jgi:hypothetical protein